MCKVYGYCRISTDKQNIERQVRNIREAYPEAVIVREAYTGTKISGRKELDKVLRAVKPGDVIVFDSVSRMSRSAAEGMALYEELFNRGITLVFLKEHHIDTDTYKADMERMMPSDVKTGDADADELVSGILSALRDYMMRLARRQICIAFEQAEKEVADLHQRTREGIETARLAGKQIGQRAGAKLTTKKSVDVKAIIRKHSKDFDGTLTDIDVMKLAGVARNTYYKYKRELAGE